CLASTPRGEYQIGRRRAGRRMMCPRAATASGDQVLDDPLQIEGSLHFTAAGLKTSRTVGPGLRSQVVVFVMSNRRQLGARAHQTLGRDVQGALACRAARDGLAVDVARNLLEVPILVGDDATRAAYRSQLLDETAEPLTRRGWK